jgi:hypothetical protein
VLVYLYGHRCLEQIDLYTCNRGIISAQVLVCTTPGSESSCICVQCTYPCLGTIFLDLISNLTGYNGCKIIPNKKYIQTLAKERQNCLLKECYRMRVICSYWTIGVAFYEDDFAKEIGCLLLVLHSRINYPNMAFERGSGGLHVMWHNSLLMALKFSRVPYSYSFQWNEQLSLASRKMTRRLSILSRYAGK